MLDPSQFRGVNINPRTFYDKGGSIAELDSWGVNLIRIHIIETAAGIESQWHRVFQIIIEALRYDIKFIINFRMACRCDYAHYLEEWQKLVPMIDHIPSVIGYDVVNEPVDLDGKADIWLANIPLFVQAMRGLTDKILVIESGKGSGDSNFANLTPLKDDNIWYGCHLYWPHPFTHQGRLQKSTNTILPTGQLWPGEYYKYPRDLSDIENNYKELIAFQDKYKLPIFIGELGCSAHTDEVSATNWIHDVVGNMCEKRGWGWTWHSYPDGGFPPREALKYYWKRNERQPNQ